MLETYLRPAYQKYFADLLARTVHRLTAVTPNQVTIASALLGCLVMIALCTHHMLTAFVLLLLSGLCDTLDGTLARLNHQCSDSGAMLDIMADRFVEAAILVGLAVAYPAHTLWCLLMFAAILLCVTSFLLAAVFTTNTSNKQFHYSPGLIERPEAFVFFSALFFMPQFFTVIACVFTILVLATTVVRLKELTTQLTLS